MNLYTCITHSFIGHADTHLTQEARRWLEGQSHLHVSSPMSSPHPPHSHSEPLGQTTGAAGGNPEEMARTLGHAKVLLLSCVQVNFLFTEREENRSLDERQTLHSL